jgi:hypothetical protein
VKSKESISVQILIVFSNLFKIIVVYRLEAEKNILAYVLLTKKPDMPDNLNKKSSSDSNRINLNEMWEVEFWIKKLQITKEKLKEAVKAVGTSVTAVRKYLQK